MYKIVTLGSLQQQAEALGTEFPPVYAFYNDIYWNTNIKEMNSSDRVIYMPYSAVDVKQETIEQIRMIKKVSPDIIYINSLHQLLLVGLPLRISYPYKTRPIIIATSHNSRVWQNTKNRLFIALLVNLMADGILTLAKFQEKWLIKYGISATKIRTIANPVDTYQFSPSLNEPSVKHLDTPNLLNVDSLSPLKNQETLIKALIIVKKDFPNVKMIFTGGRKSYPAYDNYLEKLIDEYRLKENVINIGYQEHSTIPQVYRSCDLCLFSSLNEVCPFVVLESLATGKVTISTSVGGIPDLIKNGINGFLVKPGDAEGFADNIIKVLNDRSLRCRIEKNARESAISNFSYQAIGDKHREFISALMVARG